MSGEKHELHGACACDRFQYDIYIPSTSHASQAHVFFDNSAVSRRAQATPIAAWLRIPFAWYHSSIQPFESLERPAMIRKFYHSFPARDAGLPPVRYFCGFCGTHICAWREETKEMDFADVTLGSLGEESLELLRRLGVYDDSEDDEDEDEGASIGQGLVKDDRAQVDNDIHIPSTSQSNTHEDDMTPLPPQTTSTTLSRPTTRSHAHTMRGRGIPYFEEMVENSRLGRIKRQKGGKTSRDGRMTVEWEIVEVGDDKGDDRVMIENAELDEPETKRQRRAV